MPASFNAEPIFSTGPRRFHEEPRGTYVLLNSRVNPFQAGSQPVGPLEVAVIVTGRLIASDRSRALVPPRRHRRRSSPIRPPSPTSTTTTTTAGPTSPSPSSPPPTAPTAAVQISLAYTMPSSSSPDRIPLPREGRGVATRERLTTLPPDREFGHLAIVVSWPNGPHPRHNPRPVRVAGLIGWIWLTERRAGEMRR